MNKQELKSDFEKNTFPYLDLLYNFALRMTGNEKDAGDLITKTYQRAFRFYDHLDEGTDYKVWLFRVVKNAYEDFYGKFQNNNEIKVSSGISEVLSSLPAELKTIIILSDIGNFTYEEIVAFTDCPLAVVKVRLDEGRKILFKNLKKDSKNLQDNGIQTFIKNLISENLKEEPIPEYIKERIIKKIK
jgi:RNA polymerase sigma-70 factor, ECF subfamily